MSRRKKSTPEKPEVILHGIGVSPGIIMGRAYVVNLKRPKPPHYTLKKKDIDAELKRFEASVSYVQNDLKDIREKLRALPEETQEDANILIDTHIAMLSGSRLIRGVQSRIQDKLENAEWALSQEMNFLIEEFSKISDTYIKARIDDIEAVGNRVLRNLMKLPYLPLDEVPKGGLVFARDISPAAAMMIDPKRVKGIATMRGGAAGHTAIMARGLSLPAVLGIPDLVDHVQQGDEAIIDGAQNLVILHPSAITKATYKSLQLQFKAEQQDLATLKNKKAETKDGVEIQLRVNLETPRELSEALKYGADGVGLFRTEFMFMNKRTLPTEDEQYDILKDALKKLKGKHITVRTLDIGGDKLVRALGQEIERDTNPALGLRAIRLSLKKPNLLITQFRAILRASAHGYIRVLLPLITTTDEFIQAREIYDKTIQDLKAEGMKMAKRPPPLGCMIEVPAAALSADSLAVEADFFALGTNDLTQYTVAIDRANEQVSDMFDHLNPAVLRMIEFAYQAAKRAGIPISICGEMAADPRLTGLLFGIGLRDFSVGAGALLRIKRRIRELDSKKAIAHADQIMSQNDRRIIEKMVENFNQDN